MLLVEPCDGGRAGNAEHGQRDPRIAHRRRHALGRDRLSNFHQPNGRQNRPRRQQRHQIMMMFPLGNRQHDQRRDRPAPDQSHRPRRSAPHVSGGRQQSDDARRRPRQHSDPQRTGVVIPFLIDIAVGSVEAADVIVFPILQNIRIFVIRPKRPRDGQTHQQQPAPEPDESPDSPPVPLGNHGGQQINPHRRADHQNPHQRPLGQIRQSEQNEENQNLPRPAAHEIRPKIIRRGRKKFTVNEHGHAHRDQRSQINIIFRRPGVAIELETARQRQPAEDADGATEASPGDPHRQQHGDQSHRRRWKADDPYPIAAAGQRHRPDHDPMRQRRTLEPRTISTLRQQPVAG